MRVTKSRSQCTGGGVCVVIPARNSEEALRLCLSTNAKATVQSLEIIEVGDASAITRADNGGRAKAERCG